MAVAIKTPLPRGPRTVATTRYREASIPDIPEIGWTSPHAEAPLLEWVTLQLARQRFEDAASIKAEDVDRLLPNSPNGRKREEATAPTPGDLQKSLTVYQGLTLFVTDPRFEEEYRRLGWSTGPFARPAVKKQTHAFWVATGITGARWLVKRLATESHVDVLHAVANLLAEFGEKGIGPIVRELEDKPTRDQAEVLLKALGWIEAPLDVTAIDRGVFQKTLEKYTSDRDSDVRAAAYAATRLLPTDAAVNLLARRRSVELDPYAREAIDDALSNRT